MKGYERIERKEIIEDILFDNQNYNKKELLDKTIPKLLKASPFVPIYKYLRGIGIHSTKKLQEKCYYENIKKGIDIESYSSTEKQYKKDFNTIKDKTLKSVMQFSNARSQNYYALKVIPMLGKHVPRSDREELKKYLIGIYDKLYPIPVKDTLSAARSDFGKVVCYLDKISYGWD